MNGIHDMGGMHGFGPVERELDEPVFHEPWEGRVFGMMLGVRVPVSGGLRSKIEEMDPAHYLTSSYYEKWLHARIEGLVAAGVLTQAELQARVDALRAQPDAELPRHEDPERVQTVLARLRQRQAPDREASIQPQFAVGDTVRVRNLHPAGHTRLPRYVRGKRGRVVRFYGIYDLQDARPPDTPPEPQPIYAVRFDVGELWGEAAEPNEEVHLDMWEGYLEPAGAQ
ncbi:MAG: nitrile hydratase subunit beta [Candidatus Tectomicrobia bacterium]|nr:nitrile hydratase subunit beta [Candidatus Tectomicrobia bacterium]